MNRLASFLLIFCVATYDAVAASAPPTPWARVLAAMDRRIRVRVASEPGAIVVRLANGSIHRFTATDTGEAARGVALNAAFALGPTLRNSTVFLGPGQYAITEGLRGWNGTKLWGSGHNITMIKMADGAMGTNYFVFRCVEPADPVTELRISNHCELRDLSIDVNRQNQNPGNFYGIGAQIYGSNSVMKNVRCKNAGSNTYDELFILLLSGSGGIGGTFKTGKVENLLMENCEVDGIAPGFDTAPIAITPIAVNGSYAPSATTPGAGWVENGRIIGCSVHGIRAQNILLCFQMSQATRSLVENCAVYENSGRSVVGFYTDTGSLKSIIVSHNSFLDVDVGIRILCNSASYHSDVSIFANYIRTHALVNGSGKAGIEYAGNFRTTRARLLGNHIELAGSFPGSIGIDLNDETAPFVLANTVAGFPVPIAFRNVTGATVRGNTDGNGSAIGVGTGNQLP